LQNGKKILTQVANICHCDYMGVNLAFLIIFSYNNSPTNILYDIIVRGLVRPVRVAKNHRSRKIKSRYGPGPGPRVRGPGPVRESEVPVRSGPVPGPGPQQKKSRSRATLLPAPLYRLHNCFFVVF